MMLCKKGTAKYAVLFFVAPSMGAILTQPANSIPIIYLIELVCNI